VTRYPTDIGSTPKDVVLFIAKNIFKIVKTTINIAKNTFTIAKLSLK
jgi:hypothetical protein